MNTADEAILEAMRALGGEGSISQVKGWIDQRMPGKWKDISTAMADLAYPGSPSSTYPLEKRFLERIRPGVYRLREGWK